MATAYDEEYADEYARVLMRTGDEAYAKRMAFYAAEGHVFGGEFEPDND